MRGVIDSYDACQELGIRSFLFIGSLVTECQGSHVWSPDNRVTLSVVALS